MELPCLLYRRSSLVTGRTRLRDAMSVSDKARALHVREIAVRGSRHNYEVSLSYLRP